MYEAVLYNAVAYILLCKLNYGYHNQAHFHQYLPNGILLSSKTCPGLWEKYELFFQYQILKKKMDKKLKKSDWAPLTFSQWKSSADDKTKLFKPKKFKIQIVVAMSEPKGGWRHPHWEVMWVISTSTTPFSRPFFVCLFVLETLHFKLLQLFS